MAEADFQNATVTNPPAIDRSWLLSSSSCLLEQINFQRSFLLLFSSMSKPPLRCFHGIYSDSIISWNSFRFHLLLYGCQFSYGMEFIKSEDNIGFRSPLSCPGKCISEVKHDFRIDCSRDFSADDVRFLLFVYHKMVEKLNQRRDRDLFLCSPPASSSCLLESAFFTWELYGELCNTPFTRIMKTVCKCPCPCVVTSSIP